MLLTGALGLLVNWRTGAVSPQVGPSLCWTGCDSASQPGPLGAPGAETGPSLLFGDDHLGVSWC